jgi:hypothetical protein
LFTHCCVGYIAYCVTSWSFCCKAGQTTWRDTLHLPEMYKEQ